MIRFWTVLNFFCVFLLFRKICNLWFLLRLILVLCNGLSCIIWLFLWQILLRIRNSFCNLRFFLKHIYLGSNSIVLLLFTTFLVIIRFPVVILLLLKFFLFLFYLSLSLLFTLLNIIRDNMFFKFLSLVITLSTYLDHLLDCKQHAIRVQCSIVHLSLSQWSHLPIRHSFALA